MSQTPFKKGDLVEIKLLSVTVEAKVIAEPFEAENNVGGTVLLVPVEVPFSQGFLGHGVEITRVCIADKCLKPRN